MKAIQIEEPGQVVCVEVDKPIPKQGEALIKVKMAGIFGSDIGALRGSNVLVSYPRIIGHEIVGEILVIPEDNKNGLKIGDRVIVNPYLYCGQCYPCRIGRTNCCVDLKVLGVHVDGGMTEYFYHPVDMLTRLPDDISWELAPIAEPLTIALHGIHRGELKAGEYCVIIGAGPIGLLAGMVAEVYGAHAILLDIVQERLDFAETLGIEYTINSAKENAVEQIAKITKGNMAHQVMECSGANQAIRDTFDYVCFAGRITLTGWPKKETLIPTDIITKKEIDIRGARTSVDEFEEAIELIRTNKVNAKAILTKVVSIDEAADIIKDIEKNPGNYRKVNVKMD